MIETKPVLSTRKIQFLCLLAAGILELLMIVIGPTFQLVTKSYLIVPCAVFLGVTLVTDRERLAMRPLVMGAVVVLWCMIARNLQDTQGGIPENTTVAWSAYLLALPFAAALQDGKEQKGLDLFAGCIILASVVTAVIGMLLWANILPSFLEETVYWDGARLHISWHPNNTASVFLLGTALSVRFFFRMKNWGGKTAMILLTVLQFIALTLTNSRTSTLIACAFLAGAVFFGVARKNRAWFIAACLAAVVALSAIYGVSQLLYQRHNDARVAEYIAELEAEGEELPDDPDSEIKLDTEASQRSLQEDMKSLNGRTLIWQAALNGLSSNPKICLVGTLDIMGTILDGGYPFGAAHTHNSWMEMTLAYGIPGLLIALLLTLLTIVDTVYIMVTGRTDPSQKCVALLLICLMGVGVLEPFLFVGHSNSQYCNVVFFLGLGYLEQWRKELKARILE